MELLLLLPELLVLQRNVSEANLLVTERFWCALWANYIRNKGDTSLIYWSEQFDDITEFNKMLLILKAYVTAEVIPERNWAQVRLNETKLLTLFTEAELVAYRKANKMAAYLPTFKETSADNLVRVNGKTTNTGLVRTGFAKAANTQYHYDCYALEANIEAVIRNTNKGMIKMRQMYDLPMDDASYDQIATTIVQHIAETPELYTQGISYIDSRGRAIKESLKCVANPIGYKDFRALLVIPTP